MYCKGKGIWILLAVLLVMPGWTGAGQKEPSKADDLVLIDRLAAVVSDTIILRSDIDLAKLFYPYFPRPGESELMLNRRILEDLIHYRIISLEYGSSHILGEEDYERVEIPIIEKMGSLENTLEILKRLRMTWADLKEFIGEKVLYEKVIREKFRMSIQIGYQEIRDFYHRRYVPVQKEENLEVRPLTDMTATIEAYLRKERQRVELNAWLEQLRESYRVDNKLVRRNHEYQ